MIAGERSRIQDRCERTYPQISGRNREQELAVEAYWPRTSRKDDKLSKSHSFSSCIHAITWCFTSSQFIIACFCINPKEDSCRLIQHGLLYTCHTIPVGKSQSTSTPSERVVQTTPALRTTKSALIILLTKISTWPISRLLPPFCKTSALVGMVR
jgi:hypothetical protein